MPECARSQGRSIGRDPSTVSRELPRNAATRGYTSEYRASVAQWKAELTAKRPKTAKLVTNPRLLAYVQQRLSGQISSPVEGTAADSQVPADAVTASGSGLDPDISSAYAGLQVDRVAEARGINPDQVRQIVAEHTSGRDLGFMGEPTVNVLAVDLAGTAPSLVDS